MADTQHEVLNVLLRSLLDREVIAKPTYDKAVHFVNSTPDFSAFFGACCRKEEDTDGRT